MCTSIYWITPDGPVIANNEDIFLETGMLFTNQRGIAKQALLMPPETPAQWISRYGSLSFSQCGKEFPSAGMNEAGLVIEQMTLRETRYPQADERPGLNELQMIQYLLDTCGTVSTAIEQMRAVRITQASSILHYLLVDQTGDAALVEFLDGQMVFYQGKTLPVHAVTNSTYADSLAELNQPGLERAGDDYQHDSLRRFCIAANRAGEMPESDAVAHAFQSLAEAARPDTMWRVVYDPRRLTVHIQTRWNPATRQVALNHFNFSPAAFGQVYDLRANDSGSVESDFVSYTTAINHALVTSFFRDERIAAAFGFALPDEILDGFAAYPDQLRPLA